MFVLNVTLSSNFNNSGLLKLFTAHKEEQFLSIKSHLKTYAYKDDFNYLNTRKIFCIKLI
jgi:hypothetical protein